MSDRKLLVCVLAIGIATLACQSADAQWWKDVKREAGNVASTAKRGASQLNTNISKASPNGISTGKISPFSKNENYSYLGRTDGYTKSSSRQRERTKIYVGESQQVTIPKTNVLSIEAQRRKQELERQRQNQQATIQRNQQTAQLLAAGIGAIGQSIQRNQLRREREQLAQERQQLQQQINQQQFNQQTQFVQRPVYQNQQQQSYRPQQQVYQQQPRYVQQQPNRSQQRVVQYANQPQRTQFRSQRQPIFGQPQRVNQQPVQFNRR